MDFFHLLVTARKGQRRSCSQQGAIECKGIHYRPTDLRKNKLCRHGACLIDQLQSGTVAFKTMVRLPKQVSLLSSHIFVSFTCKYDLKDYLAPSR